MERSVNYSVLLLIMLATLGCGESKDAFYLNLDAAKRAGAIETGWLPEIMPASSTEIHERHNLDTNRVWVSFKFNRSDIGKLIDQVEEMSPAEISETDFPPPGEIAWWPTKLNKALLAAESRGATLKTYRYKKILEYSDSRKKTILGYFVIDWKSDIAFYWQPAS